MEVFVTFFAAVKRDGFENRPFSLPEEADATALLESLELKTSDVGFLIVNGKDGTFKQQLQDGDRVTIIPPLMGG